MKYKDLREFLAELQGEKPRTVPQVYARETLLLREMPPVRHLTLQAIRMIPDVLEEPAPDLYFHTFNDSSIDFTLRYWIDARQINPFTATDPAVVTIQRAFAQTGIEIPYPIQTEIQVRG